MTEDEILDNNNYDIKYLLNIFIYFINLKIIKFEIF